MYERALLIELVKHGAAVRTQTPVIVWYSGEIVGEYYPDLIIHDTVIVEIKAVKQLLPEHETQLVNYLKATAIEVGLLLNFGAQPQVKRKILTNDRKKSVR